jgi:thiosulfate reductase cytochrome b subunit
VSKMNQAEDDIPLDPAATAGGNAHAPMQGTGAGKVEPDTAIPAAVANPNTNAGDAPASPGPRHALDSATQIAARDTKNPSPEPLYYRHRLPIRIMHWINVIALLVLLMSGLQIFNAHPTLNWGQSSYSGRAPILSMSARQQTDGSLVGVTTVFGHAFTTTGVFGASKDADGQWQERGFPSWLTLPGPQWLAMGRLWHFFFAWVFVLNGLVYVTYSALSRHFSRDLWPDREDRRSIGQSVRDHLRLRHPRGEAAKRYNVLQKSAYLFVIFVLLPLIIVFGWAMSPQLDSVIPGWVDLVGGRQSARTLHFLAAWLIVAFVFVHVFEVVISGTWNNLRSMISGRYRVPLEENEHGE